MTAPQFQAAVQLANSNVELDVDDSILFGCGLRDFQPVVCTLEVIAKFLRWQAMMLNGQWDNEALTECRNILRRKALVVS